MRFLLFIVLSFSTVAATAQVFKDVETVASQTPDESPVMSFESMVVDYGVIEQHGEPLRKLSFTNTGDAPLVIQNARGSCGCTVPTWPKKPILPGETAELEIRYATNRLGKFSKTVTLTTNEPGGASHVIKVQGEVLKPEEEKSVPESGGLIAPGGGK